MGGIELFRTHGYQGTGIQQILKSLHIPKGSFYNYFKSKEEFVLESAELYASSGFVNHRKLLATKSLTPLNRLKKLMENTQQSYLAESFEKSCLLDILAMEVSGKNKKIANFVDGIFDQRRDIYVECVKEGQAMGEIRSDEKAADLTEFLLTGYSGAQLKAKTEKSIRPMKVFVKHYLNYIKA